jgi:small multidrug resistance pump
MSSITLAYVWLAGAITAEVIGTTLLQQMAQFTRLLPSL